MKIIIKNCNNIDNAELEVIENEINIKYAINGTGKSTLAKGIEYSIKSLTDQKFKLLFNNLKPFKYSGNTTIMPDITGIESIKLVKVFNEDYINNYLFHPNELVSNSFEIFVKSENYDKGMEEINGLLSDIKQTFIDNPDIINFMKDLSELSECFGKSKKGYAVSSSIGKGIANGNKILNIPLSLKGYSDYLKNNLNSQWLKWQLMGKDYIEISTKCPYCISEIQETKQKILQLGEIYDVKEIEHLNRVIDVFKRLNKYFTEDVNKNINIITRNINGLSTEQNTYLFQIKEQIDKLIEKLRSINDLNFLTIKDIDKMSEIISTFKIDLEYFPYINSNTTSTEINKINLSLDNVVKKAEKLQLEVNNQNSLINGTIKDYEDEINVFLKYAGINYRVDIPLDTDNIYRMKLKHNECVETLNDVKNTLSYGEKNAFALVLFMYDALKSNADMIILDDPISSFDKNKKFAIINMLFVGDKCFKGKTVLMLTHDFDPIVDMVYNLPDLFNCKAKFLENNKGIIIEKNIKYGNIRTFIDIADENIKKLNENINKLIYLRRLYEIKDKYGIGYNLISNLLHKKPIIENKMQVINQPRRKMTTIEFDNAVHEIKDRYIKDFDYLVELTKITDVFKMIDIYENSVSNYEKLQIYRIIFDVKDENNVIRKFINDTYHIESDSLFQLNPIEYNSVPNYVIDECKKEIDILKITLKK